MNDHELGGYRARHLRKRPARRTCPGGRAAFLAGDVAEVTGLAVSGVEELEIHDRYTTFSGSETAGSAILLLALVGAGAAFANGRRPSREATLAVLGPGAVILLLAVLKAVDIEAVGGAQEGDYVGTDPDESPSILTERAPLTSDVSGIGWGAWLALLGSGALLVAGRSMWRAAPQTWTYLRPPATREPQDKPPGAIVLCRLRAVGPGALLPAYLIEPLAHPRIGLRAACRKGHGPLGRRKTLGTSFACALLLPHSPTTTLPPGVAVFGPSSSHAAIVGRAEQQPGHFA